MCLDSLLHRLVAQNGASLISANLGDGAQLEFAFSRKLRFYVWKTLVNVDK